MAHDRCPSNSFFMFLLCLILCQCCGYSPCFGHFSDAVSTDHLKLLNREIEAYFYVRNLLKYLWFDWFYDTLPDTLSCRNKKQLQRGVCLRVTSCFDVETAIRKQRLSVSTVLTWLYWLLPVSAFVPKRHQEAWKIRKERTSNSGH